MPLSEYELQYVVGFLFIVARTATLEDVIVGDRILDVASETERDVDVVAVAAGDVGMIAIEVKDEARPLGSPEVEQLAAKLNDMPSLKRRFIVSASGFSQPAFRKAKAHGVTCVRLVRGQLPRHSRCDLSGLRTWGVVRYSFASPPDVVLDLSDMNGSQAAPEALPSSTRVTFASGDASCTLQELTDWISQRVLETVQSSGSDGGAIDQRVELPDVPMISAAGTTYSITCAQATGVVTRRTERTPLHDSCYLEDEAGNVFASTCIVDIGGTLHGLSTAESELRLFRIPDELRHCRPHRQRIRFSVQGA